MTTDHSADTIRRMPNTVPMRVISLPDTTQTKHAQRPAEQFSSHPCLPATGPD